MQERGFQYCGAETSPPSPTGVAARAPQVREAIMQQEKHITILGETVQRLLERTRPAARSSVPVGTSEQGKNCVAERETVEYAGLIKHNTEMITVATSMISDLLDRLEL